MLRSEATKHPFQLIESKEMLRFAQHDKEVFVPWWIKGVA
jgi:hypothetical protein